MGNPKDDKKKMDAAKKEVQAEVKKLSLKMRKPKEEIEVLIDKKKEIDAKKDKTPDDKKELKKIDLGINTMSKAIEKHLADSNKRIDLVLKKNIPDDKKEKKAWEKGFAGGVVDLFKSDPGLKIKNQLFLGADVSISKKKVGLTLTKTF